MTALGTETPGMGLVRGAETPASIRSLGYHIQAYRRIWRGSVTTSFLYPVLYMAAMGVGLGSLVNRHHRIDGLSYLAFIAPGLLASTAMQIATNESMYPVMACIKWIRTYFAMLATPLRVVDVFLGHLAWIIIRLFMVSAIYLGIMALFGTVESPLGLVALPAAMLTGAAFAAPIMGFSTYQQNDSGFSILYRFLIVPLFLFSGTFFPITQLPGWLQAVAVATPLYHGVALCRELVEGRVTASSILVHVLYLTALAVVGSLVALRGYKRRLVD
ncbi:MAG TPA: ABC transporter permease [Acidimicrobiales bacterium]|nr:ABC transporter permease [Acidimicrobiales bacterium]